MGDQYDFGFPMPEVEESTITFRPNERPLWTGAKARLIERYLYYFVLIARHGVYIDGFAGPHSPDYPDTWAAKLVLESEPRWLRKFFLFEKNRNSFRQLEEMVHAQPPVEKPQKRETELFRGDFNERVYEILKPEIIKATEATFCLLDQRTFECDWSTLEALANYKSEGRKIELFYFLAEGWLGRAFSGQKDHDRLKAWWGSYDWPKLQDLKGHQRANLVCKRFREELGYKYAYAWEIRSHEDGGRIMYYMIHATDQKDAPKAMNRAYRTATLPKESPEHLQMSLKELDFGPS